MKSHAGFVQSCSLQADSRHSIKSLAQSAWQQLRRWHSLHRQRQQLAALSDVMLKDIGLSRADIETEANRPFWDEPLCRR